MIKFFKQIPVITKSMILISLSLYIVNVIFYFQGIYINDYLGLSQFDSEKFKLYQVLTFTFSHDIFPDHLIYNISYFLIFCIQTEFILKRNFYKLILFTILSAIIGLQFFDQNGHHVGLSIIGFSVTSYFILSKNSISTTLSIPLKLFGTLFVFGELLIFLKGYKNNVLDGEFHSSYAHMIGALSGSLFYLYGKIKKGA